MGDTARVFMRWGSRLNKGERRPAFYCRASRAGSLPGDLTIAIRPATTSFKNPACLSLEGAIRHRQNGPMVSTGARQSGAAHVAHDWRANLLAEVARQGIKELADDAGVRRVHLAIMIEPYLSQLLAGRKTIESRFTRTRLPPYQVAGAGDLVLLKRSGGPVVGVGVVKWARFFEVTAETLAAVRRRYAAAIGDDREAFWAARARTRFCSLLALSAIRSLPPLACAKRDRQAWVILRNNQQ